MNALVAPVVLPLLGAAACLGLRSGRARAWLGGLVSHALLGIAVALLVGAAGGSVATLRIGDWPATYGVVFALDRLSALMLVLSALTQTATFWSVQAGGMPEPELRRRVQPLLLLLAAGVNWAFLTADLFNLFVGFELILLGSYALLVLGAGRAGVREAVPFVVLNVVGGALFLTGAGLFYGTYGTLNLADLAVRVRAGDAAGLATALGTLLLVVFGIKAALFPLFFWLPDAYPEAPPAVLPYFAGMLTKVGVYCLFRVLPLLYGGQWDAWFRPLLLAGAAATMLVGVLGALSRWSMRHLLSFHIVSQIGYMVFGLGLGSVLGLAAGVFFLAHQVVVKTSLFLVAGATVALAGDDDLHSVRGLLHSEPVLAGLFLLAAFSLAGVPPLSGFYGKYALVLEGLNQGEGLVVTISVVTSFLTLASMAKIWTHAFWGDAPPGGPKHRRGRPLVGVVGGMVAVSVGVAMASGPILTYADRTARQLLAPAAYIEAVRGDAGGGGR